MSVSKHMPLISCEEFVTVIVARFQPSKSCNQDLVFANEDGPYRYSVTQGRFEYIGKGLSGDQSKKTPDTSMLKCYTANTVVRVTLLYHII